MEGRRITFADDTTAEVDTIIYATGYHLTFPFLPAGLVEQEDNRIRLYMRTFLPSDPTLSISGCAVDRAHVRRHASPSLPSIHSAFPACGPAGVAPRSPTQDDRKPARGQPRSSFRVASRTAVPIASRSRTAIASTWVS